MATKKKATKRARKPKLYVYTLTLPVGIAGSTYRARLLKCGGAIVRTFEELVWPAANATSWVAAFLTALAHDYGQRSELQVQRRDGTFATKNTYPRSADPKRTKG